MESSLNYLSIGGYNKTIVTHPDNIKWVQVIDKENWEIFISSLSHSDDVIMYSRFGIRTKISVNEKGIIIKQKHWPILKEIIDEENPSIVCKDGDTKSSDFDKMRSYCYYIGNCHSLGLDAIKLTLMDGSEYEILKTQYLLQKFNPFRCEIMI